MLKLLLLLLFDKVSRGGLTEGSNDNSAAGRISERVFHQTAGPLQPPKRSETEPASPLGLGLLRFPETGGQTERRF